MKKLLIYFSLFIFTFTFSFCSAQDTLVLKSEQRKWTPYILVSGGTSHPWIFSGYGASSYYSSYDGYGYSGYASNGSDFSLASGLKSHRGWELAGMFSYIRNPFDASGIMTETAANFRAGNSIIYINNVNAIGNYYYNNYSLLAGITKSWGGDKNVNIGISLMFGDFITYTPALHGIATGAAVTNSSTITQTTVSDYFNMNSKTQGNFVTELSIHIDAPLPAHFFFRLLAEIQLSGLDNGGGYQFVDMTTGNTLYSGSYSGSGYQSSSFFVGLSDITVGLGYKF